MSRNTNAIEFEELIEESDRDDDEHIITALSVVIARTLDNCRPISFSPDADRVVV